jgi:hypothetical protein
MKTILLICIAGILSGCASLDPVARCQREAEKVGLALGDPDPTQEEAVHAVMRVGGENVYSVDVCPEDEGRERVSCMSLEGRAVLLSIGDTTVWGR